MQYCRRNLLRDRQLRSFLPWPDGAWLGIRHSDGGTTGAGLDEFKPVKERRWIGIGGGFTNNRMKRVGFLLLSAGISLYLYILLHELGHMIVMLSAGATVTSFSIFTAHVSAAGGNYSTLSTLWLHANGALLPMAASFVYMLLYQKSSQRSFYSAGQLSIHFTASYIIRAPAAT